MKKYYDPKYAPKYEAKLTEKEFVEAFPLIDFIPAGSKIEIAGHEWTLEDHTTFNIHPKAIYQIAFLTRPLGEGEELPYGSKDRRHVNRIHLETIAIFDKEPTEEELAVRRLGYLREAVKISTTALKRTAPIINPDTFEPFEPNSPELVTYKEKCAQTLARLANELVQLEEKYPHL